MAQLRQREAEFDALRVQILVISFGAEYWAKAWLEETGAPYPLLLDPELRVYRAYGLERSVLRVWSPKVLWRYLRLVLAGRRLRPAQGDLYQLGGDFVVDADGIVRLARPSRDPTDRPPVEELLKVLRETAKGDV